MYFSGVNVHFDLGVLPFSDLLELHRFEALLLNILDDAVDAVCQLALLVQQDVNPDLDLVDRVLVRLLVLQLQLVQVVNLISYFIQFFEGRLDCFHGQQLFFLVFVLRAEVRLLGLQLLSLVVGALNQLRLHFGEYGV